jgi:hypothetical protein
MVTVAVDPGRRKDRGQAVQELQGREAEGGPTGRVWFRQYVEDLVGAAADEMEAFEGKRPSGTIADQALETFAVGGLDTDAPI